MIEHGGNPAKLAAEAKCAVADLLDLSVNLNPLGPPPGVFPEFFASFDHAGEYPEPFAESLVASLAARWGIPAGRIVAGNGSNLLLNLFPAVCGAKRALIVTPGYLEYAEACRNCGVEVTEFLLREEDAFLHDLDRLSAAIRPGELVILGNPNNPAGHALRREVLEPLIAAHPEAFFLVDEAFIEFCGESESLVKCGLPNLAVSRSFTKAYALPGLRMGAFGHGGRNGEIPSGATGRVSRGDAARDGAAAQGVGRQRGRHRRLRHRRRAEPAGRPCAEPRRSETAL